MLKPPPGVETARRANRDKSVQKLIELAKSRYGSVEKLLITFDHHPGEWIKFEDFSKNLAKRNLDKDGNFGLEEQQLLFEKFGVKGYPNMIPVDDVLEYVSSKWLRGQLSDSEIQYEIFEKLAKARKEAKLQGSRERVSSLVRANLEKMFGAEYNKVVPEDDVAAFVEDLFGSDAPSTGNGGSNVLLGGSRYVNNKFSEPDEHGNMPNISMTGTRRRGDWGNNLELLESLRKAGKIEAKSIKAPVDDKQAVADESFSDVMEYLCLSRVNLSIVPFLDSRMENLNHLKKQIDKLEIECNSPKLRGNIAIDL